ncbi:sporulation protein [Actinorhabdospora filicis]|uniref:sporulation protein n=1 Tax=Actinorhabdospora filicis TaxID=1785913 RepID=UPI0032DA17E1
MFKKLARAFGAGGPSVDTVLDRPDVRPGEVLSGTVHIAGGDHDVEIEHVALGLVTRVEVESGDSEYNSTVEFSRAHAGGRFHLPAGQRYSLPFQMQVPWEAPPTVFYGQHLHGMTMGVRTELSVARAIDKGDLDPVNIHTLPSQEAVLAGMQRLGFHFRRADLEKGHIRGTQQQLPFYQEIEFAPPHQYAGRINEVELTFVTTAHGMNVILEADKRGGMFSHGHDAIGRFDVSHQQAAGMDWAAGINDWLARIGGHGGGHGHAHGGYAPPQQHGYGHPSPYGHGQPHYRHGHAQYRHGRRGHGHGGAIAGGIVGGLAAGFVLGEIADDIGDIFD